MFHPLQRGIQRLALVEGVFLQILQKVQGHVGELKAILNRLFSTFHSLQEIERIVSTNTAFFILKYKLSHFFSVVLNLGQ
jgi:hypothetical protein